MTEKMLARVAVSSVPLCRRPALHLPCAGRAHRQRRGRQARDDPLWARKQARGGLFCSKSGARRRRRRSSPSTLFSTMRRCWMQKDIRLVRWMKARYFCTYYDAIKTILPGGVWLQYRELWHVNGEISAEDALSSVAPDSLEETLLRAMLSAKEIERAALDELGGEKDGKRRSARLKPAASPCARRSCVSACRISPCAWCRSASARRTRSPRSRPSAAAHPCAMRSSSFSAARGAYPAARSATTPARRCKRCAASRRPDLSNFPSARCCASAAMTTRPRARTLCSTANSRPLSTASVRS